MARIARMYYSRPTFAITLCSSAPHINAQCSAQCGPAETPFRGFRSFAYKEFIMKTLAKIAIAICALSTPLLTFAQSTAPVTRAEVRAQLVRLEAAGYSPNSDSSYYPLNIQAAEAKIAAQDAQSAVGGVTMSGTSAAGGPVKPVRSACAGAVSDCRVVAGN
jgi:hypothetical protein